MNLLFWKKPVVLPVEKPFIQSLIDINNAVRAAEDSRSATKEYAEFCTDFRVATGQLAYYQNASPEILRKKPSELPMKQLIQQRKEG